MYCVIAREHFGTSSCFAAMFGITVAAFRSVAFVVLFFFFSSRRRHTRSVSGIPAEPLFRSIWTAPLPPETELSRQMTTSTTSIDIMGLQAAYANLHTDQERDYFMQRYHDVISSFGGKTSY